MQCHLFMHSQPLRHPFLLDCPDDPNTTDHITPPKTLITYVRSPHHSSILDSRSCCTSDNMQEFSSDKFGPFGPVVATEGSKPAMRWEHMTLFKHIICQAFTRNLFWLDPAVVAVQSGSMQAGLQIEGNGTFSQALVSNLQL